ILAIKRTDCIPLPPLPSSTGRGRDKSNQRLDFSNRLVGARGIPTAREFVFVQGSPFNHIAQHARRQFAVDDRGSRKENLRGNLFKKRGKRGGQTLAPIPPKGDA